MGLFYISGSQQEPAILLECTELRSMLDLESELKDRENACKYIQSTLMVFGSCSVAIRRLFSLTLTHPLQKLLVPNSQ